MKDPFPATVVFVVFLTIFFPLSFLFNEINRSIFSGIIVSENENFFFRHPHLAFVVNGNEIWSQKHSISVKDTYYRSAERLFECIQVGLESKVQRITISFMPAEKLLSLSAGKVISIVDGIISYFETKRQWLIDNRISIRFIGIPDLLPVEIRSRMQILYNERDSLPTIIVTISLCYDPVKDVMQIVKNFEKNERDSVFVKKAFFDALHQSDIPPIDIVICTGRTNSLLGVLPLQTMYSEIIFLNCLWPDVKMRIVQNIIKNFRIYSINP